MQKNYSNSSKRFFKRRVTINIFVNFNFLSYQETILYQNRVISSEDNNNVLKNSVWSFLSSENCVHLPFSRNMRPTAHAFPETGKPCIRNLNMVSAKNKLNVE